MKAGVAPTKQRARTHTLDGAREPVAKAQRARSATPIVPAPGGVHVSRWRRAPVDVCRPGRRGVPTHCAPGAGSEEQAQRLLLVHIWLWRAKWRKGILGPGLATTQRRTRPAAEGHLSAVRAVGRRDCPGTERQFPQPDVAIRSLGVSSPLGGGKVADGFGH